MFRWLAVDHWGDLLIIGDHSKCEILRYLGGSTIHWACVDAQKVLDLLDMDDWADSGL